VTSRDLDADASRTRALIGGTPSSLDSATARIGRDPRRLCVSLPDRVSHRSIIAHPRQVARPIGPSVHRGRIPRGPPWGIIPELARLAAIGFERLISESDNRASRWELRDTLLGSFNFGGNQRKRTADGRRGEEGRRVPHPAKPSILPLARSVYTSPSLGLAVSARCPSIWLLRSLSLSLSLSFSAYLARSSGANVTPRQHDVNSFPRQDV